MATPPSGTSLLAYDTGRSEHFLADGVIELGLIEACEDVKRYIQVRKMRGVNHRLEKNQIVVGEEGISVLNRFTDLLEHLSGLFVPKQKVQLPIGIPASFENSVIFLSISR